MKKMLVMKYVSTLTKNDILNFAKNNNIVVNESEVDIIYNAIKKDSNIILSNEFYTYITKYKNVLSKEVYDKILELAHQYESFIL